jgi:ankyrin repeat protein
MAASGFDPYVEVCSSSGSTEVVRLLIKENANVNAKDNKGNTALIYASKGGRAETVKILIDHKANVNAQNNEGQTALILAAREGRAENVEILIDHEAMVDMQDKNGVTALMNAAAHPTRDSSSYRCAVTLLKASLKAHTDIDVIKDKQGRTARDVAKKFNNKDVIELFERYDDAIRNATLDEWQALPTEVFDVYIKPFLGPDQQKPEEEKSDQEESDQEN